jgi:hypothetical protein
MRAHAGYWDSASGGESTCFEHVVVDLYRTDGTLGTAEAAAAGGNSLH